VVALVVAPRSSHFDQLRRAAGHGGERRQRQRRELQLRDLHTSAPTHLGVDVHDVPLGSVGDEAEQILLSAVGARERDERPARVVLPARAQADALQVAFRDSGPVARARVISSSSPDAPGASAVGWSVTISPPITLQRARGFPGRSQTIGQCSRTSRSRSASFNGFSRWPATSSFFARSGRSLQAEMTTTGTSSA
jgi:hypothetical protein